MVTRYEFECERNSQESTPGELGGGVQPVPFRWEIEVAPTRCGDVGSLPRRTVCRVHWDAFLPLLHRCMWSRRSRHGGRAIKTKACDNWKETRETLLRDRQRQDPTSEQERYREMTRRGRRPLHQIAKNGRGCSDVSLVVRWYLTRSRSLGSSSRLNHCVLNYNQRRVESAILLRGQLKAKMVHPVGCILERSSTSDQTNGLYHSLWQGRGWFGHG